MRFHLAVSVSTLLLMACGGSTDIQTGAGGGGNVGGSSSGGAAAAGGGSSAPADCSSDFDCQLVHSCCECVAYPKSANISICAMACSQTACEALGLSDADARCVAGHCVTSANCRTQDVSCEMLEPTCPQGQVPRVNGLCYGACIPVNLCMAVNSCDVCTGAGYQCVTEQRLTGAFYTCKR